MSELLFSSGSRYSLPDAGSMYFFMRFRFMSAAEVSIGNDIIGRKIISDSGYVMSGISSTIIFNPGNCFLILLLS